MTSNTPAPTVVVTIVVTVVTETPSAVCDWIVLIGPTGSTSTK